MDVRACRTDEIPLLLGKLDQEFLRSKNRSLSLVERYPSTLSSDNRERIRVVVRDGLICGACATRFFDWVTPGGTWRGAMVGMVWVDPARRGQGLGTRLMGSVGDFLREQEADFGVLWTGMPSVYERSGWFPGDLGTFGEAKTLRGLAIDERVSCRPLLSMNGERLESLRAGLTPFRVRRSPRDYRTIPIPADRVLCFSVQGREGEEGVALVGQEGSSGYFYEMTAPPSLWETLWTAVASRFERLFVNGRDREPFSLWLAERNAVARRPQRKAMWILTGNRAARAVLETWHIPYFDWI
jgi:GNAT superfamily N-acetyltransferase